MSDQTRLWLETPLFSEFPIQRRRPGVVIPLTALQLYMWDQHIKQGDAQSQRMCAASLRIEGPLDSSILSRSIEVVVRRHESLRTRISKIGPQQVVDAAEDFELKVVDLTELPTQRVDAEVRHLAEEFLNQRVCLSVGPMFDVRLWKVASQEHVLILALDHMFGDDISNRILRDEILTIYRQASFGLPMRLPQIGVQFADYAVWQEQTFESWQRNHEGYWRNKLSRIQHTGIPSVRVAETGGPVAAAQNFSLGAAVTSRLRGFAGNHGTSLPIVVLAAHAIVMSRWCDNDNLHMSLVSHGRQGCADLERMIGNLSTFIHLRIEMNKGDRFVELLKYVQLEVEEGFAHRDFDRNLRLFPHCTTELHFNWLSSSWRKRGAEIDTRACVIKVRPFTIRGLGAIKFMPFFYDTPVGIGFTVHYRSDLLLPVTIRRFGDNLRIVAEVVAERPFSTIGSIVSELV